MVSYSIVIQKKEQKMRRKNWCVQRVDEEVVQVLRGLTEGAIYQQGSKLNYEQSYKEYTT